MMREAEKAVGCTPGSRSDGLRSMVLPHARAMGNIHRGIMAGKLNLSLAHAAAVNKQKKKKKKPSAKART